MSSLGIGVRLRGSSFDGGSVFGRKVVIASAGQNEVLVPVIGDETRVNVCRLGDVNVWCVTFDTIGASGLIAYVRVDGWASPHLSIWHLDQDETSQLRE